MSAALVMMLAGCGDGANDHKGEAKTPSASSVQEGRNYKEVVDEFEANGFTNVKTEKLEDLITGWITEDGEVEEVSVAGDVEYAPDEWMPEGTEVVITYHTFKEEETDEKVETEKPEEKEADHESSDQADEEAEETEVLTADNSPDLKEVLSVSSEADPLIAAFADQYAGRTIEFDAHTAYVNNHDSYDTRFDYLILVGDDTKNEPPGPYFQLRDVNYSDLNLEGNNIPDPFGIGHHIRITAVVEEYEERSNLFLINPVSIKMR
ncbi:DUF4839 domain-containing protein [Exiguobacterium sp. SH0S1]|uniref:DUF4839 domain-containing protein n=1 Tax=Exiguobacterium sp. SH0S1 TaxID=2510949 RepID=UPI001375D643|nr:DUF4839 domain-containing protein [Exiguobacterium sp. SH0S1]